MSGLRSNGDERLNVAVVTGTRAEWGLLQPVHEALWKRKAVNLQLIAAGAHLVGERKTIDEIKPVIDVNVVMQEEGKNGRDEDAIALGRGVVGFAKAFGLLKTNVVIVLGDRIEAFAAASAASIGGRTLVHLHGGDRAEGVADEAMRHAMTKLAHVHCCASEESAQRVIKMGEHPEQVHVTGSPAIDGLLRIPTMEHRRYEKLGSPNIVILQHPCGLGDAEETAYVQAIARGVQFAHDRSLIKPGVLWIAPNSDAGAAAVADARQQLCLANGWEMRDHLTREDFVGLLSLLQQRGGAMVGNSSAGLIECAALRLPVVNVGPRQNGRQRAGNVIDVAQADGAAISSALGQVKKLSKVIPQHPYGDGEAGERIATLVEELPFDNATLLRKQSTY